MLLHSFTQCFCIFFLHRFISRLISAFVSGLLNRQTQHKCSGGSLSCIFNLFCARPEHDFQAGCNGAHT
uniref:Putative secreted protein fat body overexpressed n=1 Tax=Rhipicephalus microplus TaxID=6941 RepID=A0A6M2DCQ9_RHIMP